MTYAAETKVAVEKTRAELDKILQQAGATQRGFYSDDVKGEAVVAFTLEKRQYRIAIPLPRVEAYAKRRVRNVLVAATREQQLEAHEQACRVRWRMVLLVVKAKLELIAVGVSSVEREFLADLVLPDGVTVHDRLKAAVAETYTTGKPLALPEHEGS